MKTRMAASALVLPCQGPAGGRGGGGQRTGGGLLPFTQWLRLHTDRGSAVVSNGHFMDLPFVPSEQLVALDLDAGLQRRVVPPLGISVHPAGHSGWAIGS